MVGIVANEEWIAARKAFLVKEKEFSRLRDQLNDEPRRLPRERVGESYVFEAAGWEHTLEELFGRCSQRIVYHFMFAPEWDSGCPHCSFWADNFDGSGANLKARDASFVAVSRAPYTKLAAYERRMGWDFEWVSSFNNQFNYDYYASFTPEQLAEGTAFYNYADSDGSRADRTEVARVSVFYKDKSDQVLHTYSRSLAGSTWSTAHTTTLTSSPTGVMRKVTTISSSGSAAMTNIDSPGTGYLALTRPAPRDALLVRAAVAWVATISLSRSMGNGSGTMGLRWVESSGCGQ